MASSAQQRVAFLHADMLVVPQTRQRHVDLAAGVARAQPPPRAAADELAFYATARDTAKSVLKNAPPLFELVKRFFEEHASCMVVPGTIFEESGFNYVGLIGMATTSIRLILTLENPG
jgi:1-deoxy-D-xylulose-5-phosphate synthase